MSFLTISPVLFHFLPFYLTFPNNPLTKSPFFCIIKAGGEPICCSITIFAKSGFLTNRCMIPFSFIHKQYRVPHLHRGYLSFFPRRYSQNRLGYGDPAEIRLFRVQFGRARHNTGIGRTDCRQLPAGKPRLSGRPDRPTGCKCHSGSGFPTARFRGPAVQYLFTVAAVSAP